MICKFWMNLIVGILLGAIQFVRFRDVSIFQARD